MGYFMDDLSTKKFNRALNKNELEPEEEALTRLLLGLSFIYHPTPRLPSSASLRRDGSPLRGLPWANGLAPRRWAGLEDSARLRLAIPPLQIGICGGEYYRSVGL